MGEDQAFCVSAESSYGVVVLCDRKITCTVCPHGKHHCIHCETVNELLKSSDETESLLQSWKVQMESQVATVKQKLNCYSSHKIEFTTSLYMNRLLKSSYQERFNISNGIAYLRPCDEESMCSTCNQVCNGSFVECTQ